MTLGAINADHALEDVSLADRLSCIADDLVELERNRPFLERLFSNSSGQWFLVDALCVGLQDVGYELKELRLTFKEDLKVTWLEYPNPLDRRQNSVVIFFAETARWSKLVLHHKNGLGNQILSSDRLSDSTLSAANPSAAKYIETQNQF